MALSKRTSRLINVDGTGYRWAFSMDSGYATIVVQHADGAGRRLEAQTGQWAPGQQRAVTPASIAALIRFAHTQGWDPVTAGPPLRLFKIDEAVVFPTDETKVADS